MAARLKLTADRRRHRCLVLAGLNSPTNTEMSKELYDYLDKCLSPGGDKAAIDHIIRASFFDGEGGVDGPGSKDGRIAFYIHPHGKDGDTPCFVINGDGQIEVDDGKRTNPECPKCGLSELHRYRGLFACRCGHRKEPPASWFRDKLKKISGLAKKSAEIMRDPQRTGGWMGAEKVAKQFDSIKGEAESI